MKNFVQPGEAINLRAPYNLESGDGVQIGSLFGIAVSDAKSGRDVVVRTKGVFDLKKKGSEAWSVGDKIFWNTRNKECTTSKVGGILVGIAVSAAASGGNTIGRVLLSWAPEA